MADLKKLKEDALRRKYEHEEMERKKQLASLSGNSSLRGANRGSAGRGRGATVRKPTAKNQSTNIYRNNVDKRSANLQRRPRVEAKKPKSVQNWVIDALLVIGGLIVVIVFVSQVI